MSSTSEPVVGVPMGEGEPDLGIIHISYARKDTEARLISWCPVCKARKRFYAWGQYWYGWAHTCCGCGNEWQDDEMMRQTKKEKQESAAQAKKDWVELGCAYRVNNEPDW